MKLYWVIIACIISALCFGLQAQNDFRQWALTPPMGWNSWDCYGPTVQEQEVKANADYMAEHLKTFGWEYIVVDIRWFVENDKAGGYNQIDPRYVMDEYGRYLPALNRFPSAIDGKGFKPLADYIHSLGLKFGIHIMRGIPKLAVEKKLPIKGTTYTADQIYSTELLCSWLSDNYTIADKPGAQEYYNSIMELYASWEVDFLKVDDLTRPYHTKEIEMLRKAIDLCGRPIVLSMSPGATPVSQAIHASTHSNMWRMVDDVWDLWKDLTHLMQVAQDWYPYISPTWPDCDMMPLGRISIRGERGEDRMTRLTQDEQYSLMSFFAIFRSPLMFGGDLPSNDPFTLSLLTNQEVLKMHRESTNVRQLFQHDGKVAITSQHPITGDRYVALFNISDNPEPMEIQILLKDIGIDTKSEVINLWTGESLGEIDKVLSVKLRPHACGLFVCKKNFSDYPIQQVKLNKVELTDDFWLPKIRLIQEKTIRYAFDKCTSEGRLENFVTAGNVIRGGKGKVRGSMPFDDTDVYKTIEGAAYSLINAPNPALDAYLDSIIGIIAYGQEPDGYLTTWRTIDPKNPPAQWVKSGGGRWFDLGSSHELYNSGHLFEAASAHYWATGKRNFLDIALKNADLLVKVFGDTANNEVPGHQIVETGLIKLYQITGKKEYVYLAKKFLDLRGDSLRRKIRGPYSQDHLPVVQQDEVVGHAVRAVYMYAGMTDIAALYGDSAYRNAINKLWNNMISRKMYITGGLGARHEGESFGDNYELPTLTAYSETCAAIGGIYWTERMFRLTGESAYIDVLERMLYNAVIDGISLQGTEFFYPNPLESDGKYKFNQGSCTRQAWFDCSCCPTNLIRFIPFIPNLIYATQEDSLYINLFVANKAEIALKQGVVNIEQKTSYPWKDKVSIQISTPQSFTFTLKIRIPSWVQNEVAPGELYHFTNVPDKSYSVLLNGKAIARDLKNGYFEITREWKTGDRIEIQIPMSVRTVEADPQVKDIVGKFAIEYGPLVYCMEEVDNPSGTMPKALFKPLVEWRPELLGGVNVIREKTDNGDCILIPYYVWSNRGVGTMKVFFDK